MKKTSHKARPFFEHLGAYKDTEYPSSTRSVSMIQGNLSSVSSRLGTISSGISASHHPCYILGRTRKEMTDSMVPTIE